MVTFLFLVYFIFAVVFGLFLNALIHYLKGRYIENNGEYDKDYKFGVQFIVDLYTIDTDVKSILKLIGICIIVAALFVIKPLYSVGHCQILSYTLNSRTAFSVVLGQCTVQTKTGAFIPVKILRDSPEGDSSSDSF